MSNSHLHSTLRQVRAHFTTPATLVVLCGVAAILALMAPYGSAELLRPAPRFVYWLVMVGATYLAGSVTGGYISRRFGGRFSRPVLIGVIGLVTGVAVAAVVVLVNAAAIGYFPDRSELPMFFLNIAAIALIITVLLQILEGYVAPTAPPIATTTPLLDRLPLDKRGALIALSVEDHYVRVRTTTGETTILLRLSDAIKEVGTTPGLQVHRSHWVATSQVTAAERTGDRATLTMTHGGDIPVSRRYIPAIKEAGLLP